MRPGEFRPFPRAVTAPIGVMLPHARPQTNWRSGASVEDAFDDGSRPSSDAPVVVTQLLLRSARVAEHAAELVRLVAVHRQRVAWRAGEQVAVVAGPLAELVGGDEHVGVVVTHDTGADE